MEYDTPTFTQDVASATFCDDANGITIDDDGEATFDWDEVETVTVENPPHADAFETKEFYKLPATVARPIKQPYQYNDTLYWLKKPRTELKKAAWSLDNAPWTMGHPETTMVKDVADIRGFWDNARYVDSLDDLDSDLHVPVTDEEAKQFIEENGDVSVGFYNKHARVDEYDGIVGGADDDDGDLDGYQVDMYFNHVASVRRGRCSSKQGCGIDSGQHGHLSFISDTRPTHKDRNGGSSTDESQFVNPDDDKWYAVPPSDNPDDEWKFPINNCSDASDAWNLRGSGDISISQDTLESRIKRRASDLGCDLPETAEDRLDCEDCVEEDCGCGGEDKLTIGKPALKLK